MHQEIDRAGLTGDMATKNMVARFVNFYDQQCQELRQKNKKEKTSEAWEQDKAEVHCLKTFAGFLDSDGEDSERFNPDTKVAEFEERLKRATKKT